MMKNEHPLYNHLIIEYDMYDEGTVNNHFIRTQCELTNSLLGRWRQ